MTSSNDPPYDGAVEIRISGNARSGRSAPSEEWRVLHAVRRGTLVSACGRGVGRLLPLFERWGTAAPRGVDRCSECVKLGPAVRIWSRPKSSPFGLCQRTALWTVPFFTASLQWCFVSLGVVFGLPLLVSAVVNAVLGHWSLALGLLVGSAFGWALVALARPAVLLNADRLIRRGCLRSRVLPLSDVVGFARRTPSGGDRLVLVTITGDEFNVGIPTSPLGMRPLLTSALVVDEMNTALRVLRAVGGDSEALPLAETHPDLASYPTTMDAPERLRVASWAARLWYGFVPVGLLALACAAWFAAQPGSRVARAWPLNLVAIAGGLWAVIRASRVSLEVTCDGVVIRNVLRSHRLAWAEVRGLVDAKVYGGEAGPQWALAVTTSDGKTRLSRATAFGLKSREAFVSDLGRLAAVHGIEVSATGTLPTKRTDLKSE